MSNNTSNHKGYLTPIASGPEYDEELEQLLRCWIFGVSGLPEGAVHPRWAPIPPQLPFAEGNGCEFGISLLQGDTDTVFETQQAASAELWRHETIDCLVSFYGPGSQRIAAQFRDGVTLNQNNEQLKTVGLSLHSVGDITPSPECINEQWVRRHDITVRLSRKVIREYGIQSLVAAPVKFFGE